MSNVNINDILLFHLDIQNHDESVVSSLSQKQQQYQNNKMSPRIYIHHFFRLPTKLSQSVSKYIVKKQNK